MKKGSNDMIPPSPQNEKGDLVGNYKSSKKKTTTILLSVFYRHPPPRDTPEVVSL
jgi:hypothetical protein